MTKHQTDQYLTTCNSGDYTRVDFFAQTHEQTGSFANGLNAWTFAPRLHFNDDYYTH